MTPVDTHICLVSSQPLPNLLPLLDPGMGIRRVILMVSADMQTRAEWLQSVIRQRNIHTRVWNIGDAWDSDHIQTRMLELLDQESDSLRLGSIALNVTGGTKLMSIATYETARAYGLPIFYVHPLQDEILWIQPGDRPSQALANRIRIEPFLKAHGAMVQDTLKRNVPDIRALELSRELVLNVKRFSKPFSTLNWLASQASPPQFKVNLTQNNPRLLEITDLFERQGYLNREGETLRFPDESTRRFVNGGWIESFVFDQIRNIRDEKGLPIQDIAYAVDVERIQRGQRIPNELDVVFLLNNRLHIIECKTRRFHEPGENSKGAEALYKLDTLRELMGGLQARAMLVSFQDLPTHDLTRAADLHIKVCAGDDLKHLRQHLLDFMGH